MKKKSAFIIFMMLCVILTSCVTTGFKDFYEPWYDDGYFPENAYLAENETPEIIQTSNHAGKSLPTGTGALVTAALMAQI